MFLFYFAASALWVSVCNLIFFILASVFSTSFSVETVAYFVAMQIILSGAIGAFIIEKVFNRVDKEVAILLEILYRQDREIKEFIKEKEERGENVNYHV